MYSYRIVYLITPWSIVASHLPSTPVARGVPDAVKLNKLVAVIEWPNHCFEVTGHALYQIVCRGNKHRCLDPQPGTKNGHSADALPTSVVAPPPLPALEFFARCMPSYSCLAVLHCSTIAVVLFVCLLIYYYIIAFTCLPALAFAPRRLGDDYS